MSQMHAGIRQIKIADFRGIKALELSFVGPNDYPTQVVVIGGPNGCGKTSVLEGCLLAIGSGGVLRKQKRGEASVRIGSTDYHIEIELQIQTQRWKQHCDKAGSPKKLVNCNYFSSGRVPGLIGPIGITAGKADSVIKKPKTSRIEKIKQFLVNARAHELFPSQDSPSTSIFQTAMNDLNRAWMMFYPDNFFTVEAVSRDPSAGFDVMLHQADGPTLSVDLLSSGQLELFSFAGELISQNAGQGLIIIDEPELHLDPQWHRQLLRAIAFLSPESQIIVATHSPEIYDSVRSFERHFIVSRDDPRADAWNLDHDHAVRGKID